MHGRVVGIGAALVVVGAALAFLFLRDSGEDRSASGTKAEASRPEGPATRWRPPADVSSGPSPGLPQADAEKPASSPDMVSATVRPKSIDDVKLSPREQGVNGVVRDPAGIEIEGAKCELHLSASPNAPHADESAVQSSLLTGSNGIFSFDKALFASSDKFVVRITHRDFSTHQIPLDATQGVPRVIFVTLRNGTEVVGTVRTIWGRPITHATVTVYDSRQQVEDPNGTPEASATTDSEGKYTVKNVTSGPKRILASKSGYGTAARPDVSLEPGIALVGADFVLNKGTAVMGKVVDEDGTPVGGALVIARPLMSEMENEARKTGKVLDVRRPDEVKVEPAAAPELDANEHEENEPDAAPNATPDAAPRQPLLVATSKNTMTVLSARTRADGTFAVPGTEFGFYSMTTVAQNFREPSSLRVESPSGGVSFVLQRVAGSVPPPPPAPKK